MDQRKTTGHKKYEKNMKSAQPTALLGEMGTRRAPSTAFLGGKVIICFETLKICSYDSKTSLLETYPKEIIK